MLRCRSAGARRNALQGRGPCAPKKAKHSWKSGGEVLTVWYVNEFLYSSGHAGTVCGAPQRLRHTPRVLLSTWAVCSARK